jgi:signal transduction histidine kinase
MWHRPPAGTEELAAGESKRILLNVAGMDTPTSTRTGRARNDRYRTAFQRIDRGFCIIEVLFDRRAAPCDYRFIEVNHAFEEQTGLRDVEGRRMRELQPEHEDYWFELYGRIARTGIPERFEHEARALGSWYCGYAFPIGEPQQRRVAILFEDVSGRRAREQSESDRERRKDAFFATLAHELRNPLFALRNGLQIMRTAAPHTEPLQSAVAMMERQLVHLVRLVDDLMDVGRIGSGKMQLQRRTLSLRQIVAASLESCEAAIATRGHDVTVECGDEDLCVFGDADRLTQVFSNLLSNSAKYTEQGGKLTVRITREGPCAVVRVTDNGIGIPPEDLHRVFELFSQVGSHATRADGGLGIGLALVRSLVQLHGGSVEAHSEGAGKGSTFTVRLPVDERQ